MKKICIFVLAAILMFGTASADRHMGISIVFHGIIDGKTETVDIFEQDEHTVAVSTLFPEYAIELRDSIPELMTDLQIFCSLNTNMVNDTISIFETDIKKWIDQQLSKPEFGFYSGELFDIANAVQYADFPLNNLIDYILNTTIQDKKSDDSLISALAKSVVYAGEMKDKTIHFLCYDEWKYFVLQIKDGENIILSVSADLTDNETRHILISCREDQKYLFRDITVSNDRKNINIESSVSIGEESAYSSVSENNILFSEKLVMSGPMDIYELNAENLSEPLTVSGISSENENGTSGKQIQISINGHKDKMICISFTYEPLVRSVSFSDKKMIETKNENEYALFSISAAAGLQELAAEIMPEIPDEYQTMMLKLLYPLK